MPKLPTIKNDDKTPQEEKLDLQSVPPGYRPRRLDVRLPTQHRLILGRKIMELIGSGESLKSGQLVTDRSKAILWIIENLL